MPKVIQGAASGQMPGLPELPDEQTRLNDKITLGLINRDMGFTTIFILAQLLSLLSSSQSIELIQRGYKAPDPNAPPLRPAATALVGAIVGAIGLIGLVAVADDRLRQQTEKYCSGQELDSALWPQVLIVITGFILILITFLRILAVRQKRDDEARVVIL